MSEPRRSTRARAREEAAPAQLETPKAPPKETPSKQSAKSLKRKRTSIAPSKDATPGTPVAETTQEPPKLVLPIRVTDGQPLPTLQEPQPLDLSSQEYQNIQQSGVLSASLQRSRAVWVSGGNFRLFHAFFTPPKKVADRTEEDKYNMQRQKEIVRNFPQVGEAQLVIEPHTFPIRLYGPREAVRQAQKKAPTYGQWPNHNHHSPYQYDHAPAPQYQPTPPPRPPPPKPVPQKTPQPMSATQAPAPDPVIHMLAQRAGQDPELKTVMKIVAAGQATKEQLEFFQGHISELTAILQKQKETAAKATPPAPAPAPPSQPPPRPPSQTVVPQPPPPTPPKPSHPPPQQQNTPTPYTPTPPQAHQPHMAPPPPHPSPYQNPYNNPYNQPRQYQQPHHGPHYSPASQPPRATYRPLVFDFVEGNGDKFYFPSYSFMEWLPNNGGAKFSFLVTKMKPKPKPKPEANPVVPSTPAPKSAPTAAPVATPAVPPIPPQTTNGTPANVNPIPNQSTPLQHTPQGTPQVATPAHPVTPYIPPPRIEEFDEKNDMKDIEFYQPVTVLVMSNNPDILQSLPRAVRPAEIVGRYMNDIFDTCRRAEETFLAFRLPKEGAPDAEEHSTRHKSGEATPTVSTAAADVLMGGMAAALEKKRSAHRPRKSLVV